METGPDVRSAVLPCWNHESCGRAAASASRRTVDRRAAGIDDRGESFRLHGLQSKRRTHRRPAQPDFEYPLSRRCSGSGSREDPESLRTNDAGEAQRSGTQRTASGHKAEQSTSIMISPGDRLPHAIASVRWIRAVRGIEVNVQMQRLKSWWITVAIRTISFATPSRELLSSW